RALYPAAFAVLNARQRQELSSQGDERRPSGQARTESFQLRDFRKLALPGAPWSSVRYCGMRTFLPITMRGGLSPTEAANPFEANAGKGSSLCENTGIQSSCRKSFSISPVSRGIARGPRLEKGH